MYYIKSYKDAHYWASKAGNKKRGKPMGNNCSLVLKDDMTIELVDTGYKWGGVKPRAIHARIHTNDQVELFYAYHGRPENRAHNILEQVFGLDVVRIGNGKYVVWDSRGISSSARYSFPTQWREYSKKMPLLRHGMRYDLVKQLPVDGVREVRVSQTDKAREWKELVRKFGRTFRVMAKCGALDAAWEQMKEDFGGRDKSKDGSGNMSAVTWREGQSLSVAQLYEAIVGGDPAPYLGRIALSLLDRWALPWSSQLTEELTEGAEFAFERLYKRHSDELRRIAGCYETVTERVTQDNLEPIIGIAA